MPIVFAPPEPLSPSISQGAGAAEQWARDFPALAHQQDTLARIYEADAAMRARGSGQAMQVAAGIQGQNAAMQAHADLQASQQQHQGQMLAQQQQGQAGLQAQHFDLAVQLNQAQLSQQEQMRLSRLRSALGSISEQVASGDLSREEGQQLALQVQTGINPLQQRQARSQLLHSELQNRQMQQQMAMLDQLQEERRKYASSSFEDRLRTVTDDFGQDHTYVLGMDGSPDWHATQLWQAQNQQTAGRLDGQAPAGGRQRNSPGTANGQGAGTSGVGMDPALRRIAIQEATALAGRDENGRQRAPSQADIDAAYERLAPRQEPQEPQEPARNRHQLQHAVWQEIQQAFPDLPLAQRRQLRDAEVNRRLGVQQTEMQRRRQDAEVRAQATARVDRALGAMPSAHLGADFRERLIREQVELLRPPQPAPQQTGSRVGLQPEVARDAAAARGQPSAQAFPRTEGGEIDRERLTPGQRVVLGQFDTARERARALPEERRDSLLGVIGRAERLAARYGDAAAMPAGTRRSYNHMLEVIFRIPRPAPPRPTRQAEPELSPEERARMEAVAGM